MNAKYTRFGKLGQAVITTKTLSMVNGILTGKFETAVYKISQRFPMYAISAVETSTTFAQSEKAHDALVAELKSKITA